MSRRLSPPPASNRRHTACIIKAGASRPGLFAFSGADEAVKPELQPLAATATAAPAITAPVPRLMRRMAAGLWMNRRARAAASA